MKEFVRPEQFNFQSDCDIVLVIDSEFSEKSIIKY
jgi:hypothetical protein